MALPLSPYNGPVWYVATTGNDSLYNGSESFPLATIQHGIDEASNGDTVLVAIGTYVENINYNGKNIVVGSLFLTTADTSYISQTVIDGNQNGSVVTFDAEEDSTTILDGFTIKNGSGTDIFDGICGGGIYCGINSSPSLLNLIVSGNTVSHKGGGIYFCDNSNSILKNVTLSDNTANNGGGIFCRLAIPILDNMTISENTSHYSGGGICLDGSSPNLENVIIIRNNSMDQGGGIVCKDSSSPTLKYVTISENSASAGGGVYLVNASNPTLNNVTITNNSSCTAGGIYLTSNSTPTLVNTILWNDSPQEIYFDANWASNSITIEYSDVQGGQDSIVTNDNGTVSWGNGNINVDPRFVNPENGDFHLQWGSPCIDAGDPTSDYSNEPEPNGDRINMGAYGNTAEATVAALKFPVSPDTTAQEDTFYYAEFSVPPDSNVTFSYDLLSIPGWLSFNDTTAILQGMPNNADVGDTTVSISVSDNYGRADTLTYTLRVLNRDPHILTQADTTAIEDSLYFYNINSEDDGQGTIRYSALVLPSWLNLDSLSGELGGIPTNDDVGDTTVSVQVSDGNGGTDSQTFTLHVQNINDAPVIVSEADTVAIEDSLYTYGVEAEDVDVGDHLIYSLSVFPAGMFIDSVTGVISWSPHNDDVGDTTVTVVVTDDSSATDDQTYVLHVMDSPDAPVIVSEADTVAIEDQLYSYDVEAEDVDIGDQLTYSLTVRPTGMTIDSLTGVISWRPDNDDVGDTTVTVMVKDLTSLTDSQTFNLHVLNINDEPIIVSIADTTAIEDSLYLYDVEVLDVDVGDHLFYSLDVFPLGMIINDSTGVISWLPDNDDVGDTVLTVVVMDDSSATDSQTFVLHVLNTNDLPFIVSVAETTAVEDRPYSYDVDGSDVDVGDHLLYSLGVYPQGMTINDTSGVISWLPDNDDVGDTTVTVVVTDDSSATGSQTFSLHVANTNDAPFIVSTADTVAIEDSLYTYDVEAEDVDVGDHLIYSLSVFPAGMDIDSVTGVISWSPDDINIGDTVITVVVTDDSLATDDQTYTLHVYPRNDPPIIIALQDTSFFEDSTLVWDLSPHATDVDDPDSLLTWIISGQVNIQVSLDSTQRIVTISAPPNWNGSEDLVFTVFDTSLASDQDTIRITVIPVNDVPSIDLVDLFGEFNGDISIEYQLSDVENDTLSIFCDYSTDGDTSWYPASVTGDTSEIVSGTYTGTIIWNSSIDVVDSDVLFRIRPADDNLGIADSTATFHVDNYQGQSVVLGEVTGEHSDSIFVEFTVTDTTNDIIDLLLGYSIDLGDSWNNAYVLGDTFHLDSSRYEGWFIWDSRTDLPGVDIPELWFRVSPSDGWGEGIADTLMFHLDNNEIPSVEVQDITGEHHGDVYLSFMVMDEEGDSTTYGVFYSVGVDSPWHPASFTELSRNRAGLHSGSENNTTSWSDLGRSKPSGKFSDPGLSPDMVVDTLDVIWHSLSDIVDVDIPSVRLKVTAADNDPGVPDSTGFFRVDNYQLHAITIDEIPDIVSDSVTISYTLIDTTWDVLNISCFYSLDWGQTWDTATVIGAISGLDSALYSNSIVWDSRQDVLDVNYENMYFKIIPDDGWANGVADSISFRLYNNVPPVVDLFDILGEQHGDISISVFVDDDDSLSYDFYYSVHPDSPWVEATVYLEGINISITPNPGQGVFEPIMAKVRVGNTNLSNRTERVLNKVQISRSDRTGAKGLSSPKINRIKFASIVEGKDEENGFRDFRTGKRTPTSIATEDTLIVIWYSGLDLPEMDWGTVSFKAQITDPFYTIEDSTGPFRVDNFQGQSVELADLIEEQTDSVRIDYTITDITGDTIDLICLYSVDYGLNWQSATVPGDIHHLDSSRYQGWFVWDSRTDLPGVYILDLWFRVSPFDDWGEGIADTLMFHLDNNEVPSVEIEDVTGEQHGDVYLSFMIMDEEGDSTTYEVFYSVGVDSPWYSASFTELSRSTAGLSSGSGIEKAWWLDLGRVQPLGKLSHPISSPEMVVDTLQVVWHSLSDIGDADIPTIRLMATVADNDPGAPDSTGFFRVDNFQGQSIDLVDLIGEQNGDVTIEYILFDETEDSLNLHCLYSIDYGMNWLDASVEGQVNQITHDNYSGHVIWLSREDVPYLTQEEIYFKIIPNDTWDDGRADSIVFAIDNNEPPQLMINDLLGEQSGDISISFAVTDDESNPQLTFFFYYSTNGGSSWDTATVEMITNSSGNLSNLSRYITTPNTLNRLKLAKRRTFRVDNEINDKFVNKSIYTFSNINRLQNSKEISDTDSFNIVWLSDVDLPNNDYPNVLFKIDVKDNYNEGFPDSTSAFHLDNYHGSVVINDISENIRRDVLITYDLFDPMGDTLSIKCQYWDMFESLWTNATITGTTSGITSENYSGSITWHSFEDLPDILVQEVFRITPGDEWAFGIPSASNWFTVDNRPCPRIAYLDPQPDSLIYFSGDITITFNMDMNPQSFPGNVIVNGSVTGNHTGNILYDDSTHTLTFVPDSLFASIEEISITLTGYLRAANGIGFDGNGNLNPDGSPLDDSTWSLSVGLLGDYDLNNKVEFTDLTNHFRPAWNTQDLAKEIGPAYGTFPYLVPYFDDKIDFEDLMVLGIMWNWSSSVGLGDAFKITGKGFGKSLIVNVGNALLVQQQEYDGVLCFDMMVQDAQEFVAAEVVLNYDPKIMEYIGSEQGDFLESEDGAVAFFDRFDSEEGEIEIVTCRLSQSSPFVNGDGKIVTLAFKRLEEGQSTLTMEYLLKNDSNQAQYGSQELGIDTSPQVPKDYVLFQNYPNPFNPVTTIKYGLPKPSQVTLKVYNILGQEVATLVGRRQEAGYYQVQWDAQNVSSGVYLYCIYAEGFIKIRKMLVLK